MQRIAHFSKVCLTELRSETGLRYDNLSAGVLQIFQTENEVRNGILSAQILEQMGISYRIVDAQEAKTLEPALTRSNVEIAGGLFMPDDETGDSHIFCNELVSILKTMGVNFMFNTYIKHIHSDNGKIAHISIDNGILTADAYVVALGPEVAAMLRPLNISLPVYPVKGYSITGKLLSEAAGPRSSVMDEHSKIMVTRLGDRLRSAGKAEITGFDRRMRKPAIENLIASTKSLFPDAIDYSICEIWTGFRPMTPDGPPRLGKTQYANLFLNAGHGSNGWTQSCGASKLVADIVSGTAPDIDISGLTYLK